MKKNDLRTGDCVMLKNGGIYIVMLNSVSYNKRDRDLLVSLEISGHMNLLNYNETLTHYDDDYSIIKVFKNKSINQTIDILMNGKNFSWDWCREDDAKEMTIENIQKELGYKVKIVEQLDNCK